LTRRDAPDFIGAYFAARTPFSRRGREYFAMRNQIIELRRCSGAVGAEILDIDLAEAQDDRVFLELRQAFNEHGVIFFRDQNLTSEQYLAVGEHFGDVTPSTTMTAVDGFPAIQEIRKEADQKMNVGAFWHSDQTFREIPVMGTMLLAREVPDYGGDTLFVSMGAAFEALSDGLKETLRGLRLIHSRAEIFAPGGRANAANNDNNLVNREGANEKAVHPVVIRHPDTGREILFVNPLYCYQFEGWTKEESAPLLKYLYEHAAQPEFSTRFTWREGSIAFWDNRQVWHYAVNDYQGQRRVMNRMMVAGEGPLH
jgi:taurine dioxygenase